MEFECPIGPKRSVHPDRRIDRAFGDGSAVQQAVLGIAPRALLIAKSLSPGAERIKMRLGIYQEIPVFFVVNESQIFRVIKCGVADIVLVDAKIVMKKDPDFTIVAPQIGNANAPQKDIVMARDRIVAGDLDTELFIPERYICDERIGQILKASGPTIPKYPRKIAVRPNAEAKRESLGMILLSDVRKIYIADLIFIVEID
jgi:hypothetical protein